MPDRPSGGVASGRHRGIGGMLHISPHSADEWGEDILGADTLADGETLEIKFSRSEKAAQWDLRVEDSEGHSIEWENLNLLEMEKLGPTLSSACACRPTAAASWSPAS
jgi:hypothetical protein